MVADSVPVTVPAAWQPRGEIFTGEEARPGQQQRFNHLNPASIDSWIVRVRAYLDERECLSAIDSPQIKDAAAFAAESRFDSSGERMSHEDMAAAYKTYVDGKHSTRRKAYNILVQWPGVLSDPQILHAVEHGQPLDLQRDALALYNKLIARKNCTDTESQEQVQRVLSMFQVSAHVKEAKAIIPQDIKYEALPHAGDVSWRRSPRGSIGHHLTARAALVATLLTAAASGSSSGALDAQASEASRIPSNLLDEATELADVSDLEWDPPDLFDDAGEPACAARGGYQAGCCKCAPRVCRQDAGPVPQGRSLCL